MLHAEEVPLAAIAEAVGTPTYVYSTATLTRHFRVVSEAFGAYPHLICYSVKANSTLAVLRLFAEAGGGFDIVSGGELARVRQAGGDAGKDGVRRGGQDAGGDGAGARRRASSCSTWRAPRSWRRWTRWAAGWAAGLRSRCA